MSDFELRELEREYANTGSYEDYLALSRIRIRVGAIKEHSLTPPGNFQFGFDQVRFRAGEPRYVSYLVSDVPLSRPFTFKETLEGLVSELMRGKSFFNLRIATCSALVSAEDWACAYVFPILGASIMAGERYDDFTDKTLRGICPDLHLSHDEFLDDPLLLDAVEGDENLLHYYADLCVGNGITEFIIDHGPRTCDFEILTIKGGEIRSVRYNDGTEVQYMVYDYSDSSKQNFNN